MATSEQMQQTRLHSRLSAEKIIGERNVYDVLKERGYIMQCTNEEAVKEYLATPGRHIYVGFDPTADSLHVGHFLQMIVMSYIQAAGHHPIALMGGGTAMIGDPSGRTDLRQMLTSENIRNNVARIQKQMEILLDFAAGDAILANNAGWILDLNYINFLREIGSQFSVNRMLTAECYKSRMEKGLTFLEFNYMLLQGYDFLELYRRYGCRLELGGDDQWSNILAGTDLIRRKEQAEAYGCTFTLLTTSDGVKMGKTAKGAVWIDEDKLPVFDFYQYWRNVDDADVLRFLRLMTFTPLEEIAAYEALSGAELNPVKELLAFRITEIVHGSAKAEAAQAQARALFSGDAAQAATACPVQDPQKPLLDLLLEAAIIPSKSEGRRLIQQGGITVNGTVVNDPYAVIGLEPFQAAEGVQIKRGKKNFYKLVLAE